MGYTTHDNEQFDQLIDAINRNAEGHRAVADALRDGLAKTAEALGELADAMSEPVG